MKVNLTASTLTFPGIEEHASYIIVNEPQTGLIYLKSQDKKRVMYMVEIAKLCDAILEKVLKNMHLMTSMIELESLFGPFFDEYFNGENKVVSMSFAVTTADASDKRQQQPDSTSSTSTLATSVTADENFDL
ncbi:hypothetical protein Tco_0843943 [Tanacetum coccineum]